MKKILTGILFLYLASQGFAQFIGGPVRDAENRFVFRVYAPQAHEVKVINLSDSAALGAKEYQLFNDGKGNWTGTSLPCRVGFHYYELSIDGARVADPSAPHYFGWAKWTSGLEVPDPILTFYQPRNVPHGQVRFQWYYSPKTRMYRKCVVYTPPGYDSAPDMRYPVLYLQHGSGESELGWTMQGKANFILDNLIAEGKAIPMIVVMDNGYAPRPGADNQFTPRGEDNLFADVLVEELIPLIDSVFRTQNSREGRAVAGLSMGGGQALAIGFGHADVFSAVGTFSGGGRQLDVRNSFQGIFTDPKVFNTRFPVFFVGCGTLESGYASMKAFHESLTHEGIRHAWSEPVGSHEWQVWRIHLYEFAQLLFR